MQGGVTYNIADGRIKLLKVCEPNGECQEYTLSSTGNLQRKNKKVTKPNHIPSPSNLKNAGKKDHSVLDDVEQVLHDMELASASQGKWKKFLAKLQRGYQGAKARTKNFLALSLIAAIVYAIRYLVGQLGGWTYSTNFLLGFFTKNAWLYWFPGSQYADVAATAAQGVHGVATSPVSEPPSNIFGVATDYASAYFRHQVGLKLKNPTDLVISRVGNRVSTATAGGLATVYTGAARTSGSLRARLHYGFVHVHDLIRKFVPFVTKGAFTKEVARIMDTDISSMMDLAKVMGDSKSILPTKLANIKKREVGKLVWASKLLQIEGKLQQPNAQTAELLKVKNYIEGLIKQY